MMEQIGHAWAARTLQELIDAAAFGDPCAFNEMARRFLEVSGKSEIERREALASGLVCAQLAAVHGELDAVQRLAAAQIYRSELARFDGDNGFADDLETEALVNLNRAADDGSELAAEVINDLAGRITAGVFAQAKNIALAVRVREK